MINFHEELAPWIDDNQQNANLTRLAYNMLRKSNQKQTVRKKEIQSEAEWAEVFWKA